jgi:uncharacterized repeat protein (TIGR01451 family)
MRKFYLTGLAILVMVLQLGNCQSERAAHPEIGSVQPLKGYELYSWQIDRDWRFALVLGTNRVKTYDEVTSPELVVQGVQVLKRELDQLPSGAQVFWSAQRVPNMVLPPDDIVEEISAHCQRLGVQLWIDRASSPTPTLLTPASPVSTLVGASAGRPEPTVTQVSELPSTPVGSVTSPAVQVPECEGHAATMTVAPSATVMELGETVKVTALLANVGCADLGLPEYKLHVRSDGVPPILQASPPAPILHQVGIAPGTSDRAEFVLRAMQTGQAELSARVSFEVHLGYPGPAYWSGTSSVPVTITVLPPTREPVTAALRTAPVPSASPAEVPASLLVHKMAEPSTARPGGVITYTIIMMNDQLDGVDPGASVVLTDNIPDCTTYVSGTAGSGARYDAVADRITWADTVPRGLSVAVSFQVLVRDCTLTDSEIENVALVSDAFGHMSERRAYVSVEEALPVAPAATPTRVRLTLRADRVPHPSPTKEPTSAGRASRSEPYPVPTPTVPAAQEDWVRYPSLNNISSLAFAPDGSLWAGTASGVVRWDLVTDTYLHYSVADGLASDDVTDLAFASDGTLWIATRGGVTRFDGTGWTSYSEADGLPSDLVYSLATGSDGSVWVGTQSGASYFDGSAWASSAVADRPPADLVWYVAIAPDGDVWFSTHTGGIIRHSPAQDTWTTYGTEDGLPVPNARFLTIGPDGAPWLHIGYHHVYRFDGTTWQLAYEAGGGRWVCDIAFDAHELPWIATCGGYRTYGAGLAHPDGGTWSYVTTRDGLVDNDVTAVAAGPDGTIAAGSDRGLSVYQAGSWRPLRTGPALSQVTAVAVTQDGAAWFGFGDAVYRPAGGGLSRFDGRSWQYLSGRDGFPLNGDVRALTVAPDGALWAGAGCGVARLANEFGGGGQAWQAIATCDALHGNVHRIVFAPNGGAWIATDFNLYHLSGGEWTVYESRAPTALGIASDSTLWMAHSPLAGGELSAFDGHGWITHTESLPMEPPVTALAVTGDGAIWAGAGHGGLARFDGQSWMEYTVADGLLSDRIVDFVVASDDVLWAITDEGLAYFNGDAWESTSWDRDLGTVNAIAFAPDGTIWLGTSSGAVHFQAQRGPR